MNDFYYELLKQHGPDRIYPSMQERDAALLLRRVDALKEAYSSPEKARQFLLRCKFDKAYFADMCVDQINPRASTVGKTERAPFFTCLRQREYLYWMEYCNRNNRDGVHIKARNIGATQGKVIDTAGDWLFLPGSQTIYGSYNDDMVDPGGEGNTSAIFPKFDFLIERLPQFMFPTGYGNPQTQKGAAPNKVSMMRRNPMNDAIMTGYAMTKDFGRGARGGSAFMDELSASPWAKEAWVTCGQTVNSRQTVFTPQGKDFAWGLAFPDEYAQMMGKHPSTVERPLVFRTDWRDIPWFNQFLVLNIPLNLDPLPWKTVDDFDSWLKSSNDNIIDVRHGYAPIDISMNDRVLECELPQGMGYHDKAGNILFLEHRKPLDKMPARAQSILYPWRIREGYRYDEVKAAQELDISFDDSKAGRVYAIQYKSTGKRHGIKRNPAWKLYAFVDPGRSSGNAFYVGWAQWNPHTRRYECLRELTMEGRSQYFFIPFLTGELEHWKFAEREKATDREYELFQEMQGTEWRPNLVICDPGATGAKMAQALDSIENIWKQHNIPVYYNHEHRGFEIRVGSARTVLRYTDIDVDRCPVLNTSIAQIAYPKESETSQSTARKQGYVHHGKWSHACAAFEYLACVNPHKNDQAIMDTPEGMNARAVEQNRYQKELQREREKYYKKHSRGGYRKGY